MKIYLSRYGKQFGPYTVEALEKFRSEGSVGDKDWAWTSGQHHWVPLGVLLAELTKLAPLDNDTEGLLETLNPQSHVSEEASETEVKDTPSHPEPAQASTNAEEPDSVIEPALGAAASASSLDFSPQLEGSKVESSAGITINAEVRQRPSRLNVGRLLLACGAITLGLIVLSTLVALAMIPEHVSITLGEDDLLVPDEGYEFVDPHDALDWRVRWVPGTLSFTRANMLAGKEVGTWLPAPGYERRSKKAPENDLVWVPQKREPEYPHVAAGSVPGTWLPDPGYVMAGSASRTAPRVVWQKGVRIPHMESAERENYWIFDPGYTFAEDSTTEQPRASWSPGIRHYNYSHVYAAPTEGDWLADQGYLWLSSDARDLRTFNAGRTIEIWRASHAIETATNGLNCSSADHFVAAIEAARDRYGSLETSEVHPLLAQHVVAVHTALKSGTATINACIVADNAEPIADVGAAVLCMFSDETWQKCMEDSAPTRKIIGLTGKLGTLSCDGAFENFGKELDNLTEERRNLLEGFQMQYGLELATPVRFLTCR